tara:strand:- start:4946 stop:5626 length:681 start_codon:yes stop_codon:yes gene_type:complete
LEIELKYALENVQQYDALIAHLETYSGEKAILLSQTNAFFDTPGLHLKQAGLILRLRTENNRFVLTAKGTAPADVTGDDTLACRLEEETEITAEEAQALLENRMNPIQLLEKGDWPQDAQDQKNRLLLMGHLKTLTTAHDFTPLGSFKNDRRVIPVSIDNVVFRFECDATHFSSSHTDYEVEIELSHATEAPLVKHFVKTCFNALGIPEKSAPGKAWRFFNQHNPV